MVIYDIPINSIESLVSWINSQVNIVGQARVGLDKITVEFTHDTTQQLAFKKELAKRLLMIDDSIVKESLLNYMQQLLGDHLFCSVISSQTKTNVGTTYVDVFPSIYQGVPMGIDTTGYTKVGVRILWNKNGGTSRHDCRLVNSSDTTKVLASTEGTPSGLATGVNTYMDVDLPSPDFIDFRGDVKLQCKAGNATDDPIFDAIWIYLIR